MHGEAGDVAERGAEGLGTAEGAERPADEVGPAGRERRRHDAAAVDGLGDEEHARVKRDRRRDGERGAVGRVGQRVRERRERAERGAEVEGGDVGLRGAALVVAEAGEAVLGAAPRRVGGEARRGRGVRVRHRVRRHGLGERVQVGAGHALDVGESEAARVARGHADGPVPGDVLAVGERGEGAEEGLLGGDEVGVAVDRGDERRGDRRGVRLERLAGAARHRRVPRGRADHGGAEADHEHGPDRDRPAPRGRPVDAHRHLRTGILVLHCFASYRVHALAAAPATGEVPRSIREMAL